MGLVQQVFTGRFLVGEKSVGNWVIILMSVIFSLAVIFKAHQTETMVLEMSDLKFDNSLPLLSLEYLRNDSVQHPTFCYSNDKSLKSTDENLIIVWDGAAVGEILKSKVGYVSSTIAKLEINKNENYVYLLQVLKLQLLNQDHFLIQLLYQIHKMQYLIIVNF